MAIVGFLGLILWSIFFLMVGLAIVAKLSSSVFFIEKRVSLYRAFALCNRNDLSDTQVLIISGKPEAVRWLKMAIRGHALKSATT